MLVAASSPALWYLSRATGLVSLLLLTGSVVLGIAGAQRWASPRWPRLVTGGLHKNVSLLAVAFVAVHVVTAVADSFVTITWVNVFVPFTGTYRPLWLGLGAVAGDLLIALIITSLLRPWIGYRVWRTVHWAAYACWPIALVHGLGTGSDAGQGWARAVLVLCVAAVGGATWWRLDRIAKGRPAPTSTTVGSPPAPRTVRPAPTSNTVGSPPPPTGRPAPTSTTVGSPPPRRVR